MVFTAGVSYTCLQDSGLKEIEVRLRCCRGNREGLGYNAFLDISSLIQTHSGKQRGLVTGLSRLYSSEGIFTHASVFIVDSDTTMIND